MLDNLTYTYVNATSKQKHINYIIQMKERLLKLKYQQEYIKLEIIELENKINIELLDHESFNINRITS